MDENYQCDVCGNDKLFYNEVSLVAKKVFNQTNGKTYIRDKTNIEDNFFQPVHCYKCGHCVDEG